MNCPSKAAWKWRNIATSLVHSAITAVWSPLGFYLHPEMCADVAFAFNHSTHMLISFSVGYFIYDFLDMYLYNQKNSQKNTYELLIHHACAIACFGVSSHTRTLCFVWACGEPAEAHNAVSNHSAEVPNTSTARKARG